ncbi:MAG: transposase, partial [Gammaproteobacteria bacterium]|nr:transposase [Gammaproteobacteria bacterium]
CNQLQIPVSAGSIYNFNREAYGLLEDFEKEAKVKLAGSPLLHVDETGININGSGHWLHSTSNGLWTYFFPHKRRGTKAMNAIGILPEYVGTLCHDHWKPDYTYDCIHALCNAHHLRELTKVWEDEKHQWARDIKELLEEICHAVNNAGGLLAISESEKYQQKYITILQKADVECPPPDMTNRKGKRGPVKRTKARNLLERLLKYKDDVLRFMDD